jgi:hypothetical protein
MFENVSSSSPMLRQNKLERLSPGEDFYASTRKELTLRVDYLKVTLHTIARRGWKHLLMTNPIAYYIVEPTESILNFFKNDYISQCFETCIWSLMFQHN